MPQSTPNLNLVTYDLTTDAGVYFSTFRTTLAGYTNSALTKIDTWAGQVNADLTTLKQTPSITRVSAIKQSDFIYSATIPTITQYSTNSFINLSLDNDNVGVVSLEINTLGGKSLLKYNSTGIAVNVSAGDLRKNKNNLFTYNGTAWIWVNAISSDQLNVVGTSGNLLRVSSSKTVEDSGVTYGTTVTNNNIVQRTSTGQIKGATASANDDVVNKLYADTIDNKIGALSSLTTTNKTSVVNAVNEVEGRDYSYGVPVQAFLPFENINAQFLGSYPPSYYAKQTELGTISSLTTTSKTSAVLAINELDSEIGTISTLTTANKTNIVNAINEVDSDIGNLTLLTTSTKTNTVGAINEVDSEIATVDGKIGILSGLTTVDKTSVVSAINENVTNIATNTSAIGQIATEYIMQNSELLNAWIFLTETKIAKTKNVVTISGGIQNGVTALGTQLALLPLPFRPKTPKYFSVGMYGTSKGSGAAILRLGIDGILSLYNQVGDTSIFLNFSYII